MTTNAWANCRKFSTFDCGAQSAWFEKIFGKISENRKAWKIKGKNSIKQFSLEEEVSLWNVINRMTCMPNHEAGCERGYSNYNRAKNKLSSTMKMPKILARNRVGANGPPLHLFNPAPIVTHWKKHHTLLAEKVTDPGAESRVVTRIRAAEEATYTSKIFL